MEIGMSMSNDVICSDIAMMLYFFCVSKSVSDLLDHARMYFHSIHLSLYFCCHSYAFAVNGLMAMLQAWEQPQGKKILQWSGTDPCGSNWIGIHCDNSSPQRVTQM